MKKAVIVGTLAYMAAGRLGTEWIARSAQAGSYWKFSDKCYEDYYEKTKETRSMSKGTYHVLMELVACMTGVPVTIGAIILSQQVKNK